MAGLSRLSVRYSKDSETIESLKQSLLDQLPADEAIPTVMTVRMKLDSNTLGETGFEGTDWVYPTDVGVLKEAMKRGSDTPQTPPRTRTSTQGLRRGKELAS